MAIDNIKLYNFYFRYKWNELDFANWQQGLVDTARGASQGAFGAACLQGLAPTTDGSSLNVGISEGIAVAPDGALQVISTPDSVSIVAPTANPYFALVVLRTVLIPGDPIPLPTNPALQVPLTTQVSASIEVIYGSESNTPTYPSKLDTDTILFGVRVSPLQTVLNEYDIDLEVREIVGVNSLIQQNYGKYDDRLRPFINSTTTLGVYPSQLRTPNPLAFSYVNSGTPSIFPQSSLGVYNHAVTYLDFLTGAITGGDALSPDFTPTIPGIGFSINAVVSLLTTDLLSVSYGLQGTFAQCYAGIVNNQATGPGSVVYTPLAKPIVVVTISSLDGVGISDIKITDLRGFTAVPDVNDVVLTGNVDQTIDGSKTFLNNVSCTAVAPTLPQHFIRRDYVDGFIPILTNTNTTLTGVFSGSSQYIRQELFSYTERNGEITGSLSVNFECDPAVVSGGAASFAVIIKVSGIIIAESACRVSGVANAIYTDGSGPVMYVGDVLLYSSIAHLNPQFHFVFNRGLNRALLAGGTLRVTAAIQFTAPLP